MLYKRNLLTLKTIGYIVGYCYEYCLWAKWPFYSCDGYIALFGTGICRYCIWVELSVQKRLCQIFVKNVGSPDICEYSAG